jgi:hypothetical protein
MFRVFSMVVLAVALASCDAGGAKMRDLAALHDAPLYTFSEREIDAYLRWLAGQPMGPIERVTLLARKNIGQPYRIFLLGEHPFELYDPDPMYCLDAGDCVTFVEHTYALALSHDWPSFFQTLQRIRYQDGRVGILTRNHFTEADWNINNAWLFDDLTSSLAEGLAVPMRTRIDRAAFFAKYGIAADQPVETFEDLYIPRHRLPAVLAQLQDGDIIEIVRGDSQVQSVTHVGLIMHNDRDEVTILHSSAPGADEESLERYFQQHPGVLGLKILRMTGGAEVGLARDVIGSGPSAPSPP